MPLNTQGNYGDMADLGPGDQLTTVPERDHLQDLSDRIAAVRDYRIAIIDDITGLQKRADTLHKLLNDIDKTLAAFEEQIRCIREDRT